jgi:hypothetical protein
MGVKYNGGDVFDAAIQGLMAVPGVTDEMVYETARPLIRSLLDLYWDNADGTVGMYDDKPAIVAAFKDNGIMLFCGGEHPDDGESCEGLERGHAEPHRDHLGRIWTDEESVT